jgi:small subunit ribosomal protein S3
MGQKVNPISFRLGYCKSWNSLWYANKKDFADKLLEDKKVRDFIKENYKQCAISKIVIERASEKLRVNIHTARPGVLIGRKGSDIDRLRDDVIKLIGKEAQFNIREVKNPSLEAQLIAENVALQLEKRIAFRRAMKKAMQQSLDAGAKGIKIRVKGRLGGSEIARAEWYRTGSVPLHTIRADVDYGFTEAHTTYGKIGIKVWIYKGDIIERPNLFNIYDTKVEEKVRDGASKGRKAKLEKDAKVVDRKPIETKYDIEPEIKPDLIAIDDVSDDVLDLEQEALKNIKIEEIKKLEEEALRIEKKRKKSGKNNLGKKDEKEG